MHEPKRYCSEPWRYTMTARESQFWRKGDRSQRQRLLECLAARVLGEAVDHDRNRFVIMDEGGEIVAKGKIQAPNLDDELERMDRAQNRLN
ncbi:MAG: hypothetical protein HUU46_10300 [Candidatus Hydrogenedentes bacterium]|nr:hypothetical protein [Candidatus Hydrogenedentota bacterium]